MCSDHFRPLQLKAGVLAAWRSTFCPRGDHSKVLKYLGLALLVASLTFVVVHFAARKGDPKSKFDQGLRWGDLGFDLGSAPHLIGTVLSSSLSVRRLCIPLSPRRATAVPSEVC